LAVTSPFVHVAATVVRVDEASVKAKVLGATVGPCVVVVGIA